MNSLKMLMSIAILTPMGDPRTVRNRWGAPFVLVGEPGTGKTSFIAQVAERMELMSETMYLSAHPPEDLSGIPVVHDGKGTLINFVPQIARLVEVGSGILNLDELTTARESTQNAAMNLVLERTIAGARMAPRIRVVGAANPPEQAAGARDLSPPAANRFLHFESRPLTLEQWAEHERHKSLPDGTLPPPYKEEHDICTAEEGERRVTANWAYAHSKQVTMVAAFHESAAGLLQKLPPVGSASRGHAWASARSWSMATATMATASALAHEECSLDLLTAAVGVEAATAYAEWLAHFDLPKPEEVLDGSWRPSKLRLDIATTAYSATVLYVLNTRDTKNKIAHADRLWTAIYQGGTKYGLMDIVKPIASDLVSRGLSRDPNNGKMLAAAEKLLNEIGVKGHGDFPEKAP